VASSFPTATTWPPAIIAVIQIIARTDRGATQPTPKWDGRCVTSTNVVSKPDKNQSTYTEMLCCNSLLMLSSNDKKNCLNFNNITNNWIGHFFCGHFCGRFFRRILLPQILLPRTVLPRRIKHFLFVASALFKVNYVVKPLWETIYFDI